MTLLFALILTSIESFVEFCNDSDATQNKLVHRTNRNGVYFLAVHAFDPPKYWNRCRFFSPPFPIQPRNTRIRGGFPRDRIIKSWNACFPWGGSLVTSVRRSNSQSTRSRSRLGRAVSPRCNVASDRPTQTFDFITGQPIPPPTSPSICFSRSIFEQFEIQIGLYIYRVSYYGFLFTCYLGRKESYWYWQTFVKYSRVYRCLFDYTMYSFETFVRWYFFRLYIYIFVNRENIFIFLFNRLLRLLYTLVL